MHILKSLLFILAVILVVELSFRIYLYGPGALHPGKMDSFTQVHDSGLVRAAGNPAVHYELRQDLDVWYKGVKFRTNSAGLRDSEYSLEKPANTFRIVVLGSSWTMGSGVDLDEIWHSKLEQWLNAENAAKRVELINFGVDQYGFGEIIATLEDKALAYEPDLILIALTYFTPTVLWQDPPVPYVEADRRHPLFDLHSARFIDFRLQLGLMGTGHPGRNRVEGDEELFKSQLHKAGDRLQTISTDNHIPIAFVKLAYQPSWVQKGKSGGAEILSSNPVFRYIDVTDRVKDSGYSPGKLSVSVWDSHPNALGHKLMAKAILEELFANDLLPEGTAAKLP